jgi:hypothetical protein
VLGKCVLLRESICAGTAPNKQPRADHSALLTLLSEYRWVFGEVRLTLRRKTQFMLRRFYQMRHKVPILVFLLLNFLLASAWSPHPGVSFRILLGGPGLVLLPPAPPRATEQTQLVLDSGRDSFLRDISTPRIANFQLLTSVVSFLWTGPFLQIPFSLWYHWAITCHVAKVRTKLFLHDLGLRPSYYLFLFRLTPF